VLASTSKRDAAARMDALTILQDRDEHEAFDRALEHLRDHDAGVRSVAAALLGDSGDSRAISGLHKALEHERVPQIREAVAAALVKLDPDYDDQGAAGARGEAVRRDRVVRAALDGFGEKLDQAGAEPQARDATPPVDTEVGSD
jgi:HEAT repeat protein